MFLLVLSNTDVAITKNEINISNFKLHNPFSEKVSFHVKLLFHSKLRDDTWPHRRKILPTSNSET